MIHPALVLHLQPQQAEQLALQCAAYRKQALQCLAPSPERNRALRVVQAVEGRLHTLREQRAAGVTLSVTPEEAHVLRQMVVSLMHAWGGTPESEERTQAVSSLAILRVMIERALSLPPSRSVSW